ncbi:hypothetical protein MOBT1_000083 [Malassezia obtusa]|uniref:Beta-catenin-like protein 1 N-terminal domain-containing protein n=1 Tax=Malassezia obtusa TaxID=76774 RepID=A0AAF0DXV2_9BASI|nr:hypothetical protein MOBT1_000083 [Malassezia obtusa]
MDVDKLFKDEDDDEGYIVPGDDAEYEFDEDEEGGRFFGGGLTEEQKRILQIMNRDGEEQVEEAVRPMALMQTAESMLAETRKQMQKLEKALSQNQAMRLKYPDEPQRFITSEADLNEELRQLVVLTTNCALLYPEFVRLGGPAHLLELLSHENADIAAATIQVLEELTDDDVLDNEEGPDESVQRPGLEAMHALVRTLREGQVLALLVSNLSRFNDKPPASDDVAALENYDSDVQGVYHTLSVLENLVSLQPDAAEDLVAGTPLIPWLLQRMQFPRFDQNMAYAGELLAILLQDSEENREVLGKQGGIDALLKTLAPYRKRDPVDEEETEFMENGFDALCSALLLDANKPRFLHDEGVELMVLILREKRASRLRALKVLDHALSGVHGAPQCERFVESLGLKSLFAVFMLPLEQGKKNRAHHTIGAQDMEHVLGILASLLHNLASDSPPRIRVLAKFVEQDYAKIDRLLELRESTVGRVRFTEQSIADEERLFAARGMDQEAIAELAYLRRLESGLYSLQLIDYLLGWILMEDDGAQAHIRMLLERSGVPLSAVIATLEEYRDNVGDAQVAAGGTDDGMRTQDIVQALLEYVRGL